jgi:hypothetical protein
MPIIVICKIRHHIKSSHLLDLGDGIENTSYIYIYIYEEQGSKLKIGIQLGMN